MPPRRPPSPSLLAALPLPPQVLFCNANLNVPKSHYKVDRPPRSEPFLAEHAPRPRWPLRGTPVECVPVAVCVRLYNALGQRTKSGR